MGREPLLSVRNLAVSFSTYSGEVQAVRGISWELAKAETVAIVGESGCGKTVSIQTVMGLLQKPPGRIRSGEVIFEAKNILECTAEEMRRIQGNEMTMIFQDPLTYLNPTMRIGDQIAEAYIAHRKVPWRESNARVLEMMRLVGIPSPERTIRFYPHQLSGGMRQRVMIAMSLVNNPKVVFADEPTTALDVTIQAQIIALMNSLKERMDTSIVLVTHDLGVVAGMADRVYVMYAGKIVEQGDVDIIFERPMHPYTWALLKSIPRVDSDVKEPLTSIAGTPPDLIAPPRGCAFAARCPYAMRICERCEPSSYKLEEEGHYAACWLHEPAAGGRFVEFLSRGGVRG